MSTYNENGVAKGCYGYSSNGFSDMTDTVLKSWTYNLLTPEEQLRLIGILRSVSSCLPTDLDYEKGWNLCSDIHSEFIRALGYKNGIWPERENKTKETRTVVQTYPTPFGRVEIVEITNSSK